MNLLAIDTSQQACSIALLHRGEITTVHRLLPMQQTEFILPLLKELLETKKVTLKQLDALVLGVGPGSFTGIRLAASVAQGLAYGLNLPVIPISSLAALAQSAVNQHGWDKLLVAVDARVNEVYWAMYIVAEQGLVRLQGEERLLSPENLDFPETSTWYGVGDAWQHYRTKIVYQPQAIDATILPDASALLQLAETRFLAKDWAAAQEALPCYLREQVAKKCSESSHKR